LRGSVAPKFKSKEDLVMGALRTRMIEEMTLRNFSPRTQECYLGAMIGLAKHYRRSPDQLTQEEIRAYLLHLEKRGLSPSSRNVAISGMKFFYHQMLGWNDRQLFIPPRKRSWQLPEVLGQKEVERLLLATTRQRDRCLLMTAYANDFVCTTPRRAAFLLEGASLTNLPFSQPKGRPDIHRLRPQDLQSGQGAGRHPKRPRHPYPQALLCHTSFGGGSRSANHSDAFGATIQW